MRVFLWLTITQVLLSCGEYSVAPEKISKIDSVQVNSSQPTVFNFFAKDLPLGSEIEFSTLTHYNFYGQFIDDGLLDFYTAEYPGFEIFGETPETVVLEYKDCVLIQKRYSFAKDIFNQLNEQYLISQGIDIKEQTKIINLNFASKKLSYQRSPPYFLYESIRKK